jgi:hypothetical protein
MMCVKQAVVMLKLGQYRSIHPKRLWTGTAGSDGRGPSSVLTCIGVLCTTLTLEVMLIMVSQMIWLALAHHMVFLQHLTASVFS